VADDASVRAAMTSQVVSVRSTDTVSDAMERMLTEQVEHLPVIDGDQLVGICTRTDVLRARGAQFAHEHPEPGWLTRRQRIEPA
jgi:CBS domain-containing protein